MRMTGSSPLTAHLFHDKGTWRWSGHNACGDPCDGAGVAAGRQRQPRPFDAVVDLGREFIITSEGRLYLLGPGPGQFSEWEPGRLVEAARMGLFGFRLEQKDAA